MASGATQPNEGTVIIDGQATVLSSPLSAMAHGIHVVHQQPKLLEFATIAENIFLPRLARARGWQPQRNAPLYRESRDLLERLGLGSDLPDVKTLASQLTPAARQLVAVAKALAEDSRVIFLDEPNSSLTERETAKLWGLVERLQGGRRLGRRRLSQTAGAVPGGDENGGAARWLPRRRGEARQRLISPPPLT